MNDFTHLAANGPLADLAEIRALTATLHPDLTLARIDELRRGGLPTTSLPNGPRGTEQPLPQPDRTDRQLDTAEKRYRTNITAALDHLRKAHAEQRGILHILDQTKAQQILVDDAQGTHRFQCLGCDGIYKRTVAQRPRSGRCRYCHDWWIRNGRPTGKAGRTPPDIVDAMIVRESQRAT